MRNGTTPLIKQLSAAGLRAPTVTPGAAIVPVTFNMQSFAPAVDDMLNYLQATVIRVTSKFDQAATGGSVVNWDKLYKILSAVRQQSPMLGETYPAAHTRGSVLAHVYQVIGGGYSYPQPARAQIAAADGDTSIDLFYVLPYAQECLSRPQETCPWISYFEGGELEVRFDVSTVFDGDSTGAVTKATSAIRAWVEYLPSPDRALHVPFQFREYIVPGGGTEFILRNVGGQSGLRGVESGCGLAALYYLTDAPGIGLSGQDGADNITRLDIPWRNQESIDTIDPLYVAMRQLHRKAVIGPPGPATALINFAGWPNSQAAVDVTTNNAANALGSTETMVVPLVTPGTEVETSKLQRVSGDLRVNFGFTSTPSGSAHFASLEFLEHTAAQKVALVAAMGINPSSARPVPKTLTNSIPQPKQLRYTRTMIVQ